MSQVDKYHINNISKMIFNENKLIINSKIYIYFDILSIESKKVYDDNLYSLKSIFSEIPFGQNYILILKLLTTSHIIHHIEIKGLSKNYADKLLACFK